MSSEVDTRVVEMQFDNKEFEKGVSTTINSIDDLKKSLQFDNVDKGFKNISKGLESIEPGKLSSALDVITNKFSKLGVIGDQALRSISNTITVYALKAFKDLTNAITGAGYAMQGFSEYETKIGSIQTIAANTGALRNNIKETALTAEEEQAAWDVWLKGMYGYGEERMQALKDAGLDAEKVQNRISEIASGTEKSMSKTSTTLKDIDSALDDLNDYADKTIYNFSQMTKSIGQFTVAGINLEDSVEAVKGISNLAAFSGATAEANNRAMYNISQSLQSGYMQLIDWKSVANAGMGGKEFKDAIMETARVHGVAIDQIIADKGSFEQSLQERWLTSDILLESLAKFTSFNQEMSEAEREAERTKWREIGYTEQQIADIEELSRISYEAATKVRTYHQLMDTLKEEIGSSYTMMWQNIVGNFEEATELWTNIHNAIEKNFLKPMTEAREAKWKFFHDNGGREAAIRGLSNVISSLYKIIHAISEAWHEIFPKDDGRRITAIAKAFADFTERIKVSDETAEKIKITFQGLFSVFHIGVTIIKGVAKIIGTIIGLISKLGSSGHPILEATAALGKLLIKFDKFLTDSKAIENVVETIINLIKKIPSVLSPVANSIGNFFEEHFGPSVRNTFDNLTDKVKGFAKSTVDELNGLKDADMSGVDKFGEKVRSKISPIGSTIIKVFGTIKTVALKVWNWIKEAFVRVANLISSTGGKVSLADVLKALIGVETFKMVRNLAGLFSKMKKTVGTFEDVLGDIHGILGGVKDVLKAYALEIKAEVILKIALAVLMLCGALIALSRIDQDALWNAVGAMTALFIELGALTKLLTGWEGDIIDSLAENKGAGLFRSAGNELLKIATSILILVSAMKSISKMDKRSFESGMAGITILFAEIYGFVKMMGKDIIVFKGVASTILAIAVAIDMLLPSILALGALDKTAMKGVKVLAWIMGELAGSIILISLFSFNPAGLKSSALALIAIAAAVDMLLPILTLFSFIPEDKLKKSVGSLFMIIVSLSAGVLAMSLAMKKVLPSDIMAAGVAMIELSTAINMLTIPILTFALMSPEMLTKGVATVMILLTMMAVILHIIPKDAVSMAGTISSMAIAIGVVAGAMWLLSGIKTGDLLLTTLAIGVILLTLVAIFKAIAEIKTLDDVPATLGAMALVIGAIALSLYGLSQIGDPEIILASAGAIGIVLFALAAVAYMFGKAKGSAKAIAGITALGTTMLKIGAGLALAGLAVLLFVEAWDRLIDVFVKMDTVGSEALSNGMHNWLQAIVDNIPLMVDAVFTLIDTVIAYLVLKVPYFVKVLVQLLGKIIKGIYEGLDEILTYTGKIIIRILDFIKDMIYDIADRLIKIITAVIRAVAANTYEIVSAAFDLVISVVNSVGLWLQDDSNLSKMKGAIENLAKGIANLVGHVFETAFNIGAHITNWLGLTDIDPEDVWKDAKELFEYFHDWVRDSWAADIKELVEGIMNPGGGNGFSQFLTDVVQMQAKNYEEAIRDAYKSGNRELAMFYSEGYAQFLDKAKLSGNINMSRAAYEKIKAFGTTSEEIYKAIANSIQRENPTAAELVQGFNKARGVTSESLQYKQTSMGGTYQPLTDSQQALTLVKQLTDPSSIFNPKTFIKTANDLTNLSAKKAAEETKAKIDDVIAKKMDKLDASVNRLEDAMSGMKIYLDGNVVGGVLVNGINGLLGKAAILASRTKGGK